MIMKFNLSQNEQFQEITKKRWKRIAVCTFGIAILWCSIDFLRGNLSFNLWDDLICLGLGILTERIIPWGKSAETEVKTK